MPDTREGCTKGLGTDVRNSNPHSVDADGFVGCELKIGRLRMC